MWCVWQYLCITLKDKNLILVYTTHGSIVDQCYSFLSTALSLCAMSIVYGSSLICSDCESDAGVYCHCTLFCIYFVIFFHSFFLSCFLSFSALSLIFTTLFLRCFENSIDIRNVSVCVQPPHEQQTVHIYYSISVYNTYVYISFRFLFALFHLFSLLCK